MSDTPEPQNASAVRSAPLIRFQEALVRAGTRSYETRDWSDLIAAARDLEAAGHLGDVGAALHLLGEQPLAVLRRDAAVRSGYVHRVGGPGRIARPATIPPLPTTGPLVVAIASLHPDGRVRAQTVRPLLNLLRQSPPPLELLPYLVLRTTDWAPPVRNLARAVLAVVLLESPEDLVEAVARVVVLTNGRKRGEVAHQQVLAALLALPGTTCFDRLLGSPDRRLRRFAMEAALLARRFPVERLAALAETDSDQQVRGLAAEAAVREAVWTDRLDLVRRLAAGHCPEVRAVALTGLLRAGQAEEVAGFFGDPSQTVRAVSHEAIRRTGGDVLEHYRAAAREPRPSPGAIVGLAEIGDRTDSDAVVAFLSHSRREVRAAARRALRTLDVVPPLLRDPPR
ncbi:hypothetical protein ACFW1A_10530 [Kitasatospora sp. NPDC058965]|uniref:hypothetical protein n=1 Tax=Kitasatospora sp. NPDC058965 TaxID=3346682 RepID=UPI00369DA78E